MSIKTTLFISISCLKTDQSFMYPICHSNIPPRISMAYAKGIHIDLLELKTKNMYERRPINGKKRDTGIKFVPKMDPHHEIH